MRLDHASARARGRDEIVAMLEFPDELGRKRGRALAVARVVARLAAARLRGRNVDFRADSLSATTHIPISCCGKMPSASSARPFVDRSTRVSSRASIGAESVGSSKYMSLTMR